MASKEKVTLTLNSETKEKLNGFKEIIPEVTSLSNAVDYVIKDYWRIKKEMEFIDAQTLNAAQRMTAMDINISVLTEMVTHLCYESATQIDENLDYFKREDLNLETPTVFDQSDPMYELFRKRVLAYRRRKKQQEYL